MTQEMKVSLVADVAGFNTDVKQAGALYDRFGKQIIQTSGKVEAATQQTQRSFNNLDRVSGSAGASVLSFSRIVQDAPFGIIGVGNNITQLVESFGALRASSKSTGAAMKAFFTSLIAPGNLLVLGISAVTTAFTIMALKSRGAKEEVKTLREEIDDTVSSLGNLENALLQGGIQADKNTSNLRILWKVINDATTSVENRTAAIKELQKLFPDYFGKLTQEEILTKKGADAYAALTKNIVAASNARAAQTELDKATQSVRENNKFIESNQRELDQLDEKIVKLRAINTAEKENSGLHGEVLSGIGTEKEIGELLDKRAAIEGKIRDTKLKNIQLTGEQSKLEKEILSGISEGGVDPFLKNFGDIEDSAKATRVEIEAIQTDLKSIGDPIAEGFLKATKEFDKGFSDSVARMAQQLSGPEFADVLKRAQEGNVPKLEVQVDLKGPKGGTGFVDSGVLAEQLAQVQEFSQSVGDVLGSMYSELILGGEDAFDNINRLFERMIKRMIADVVSSGITRIFTSLLGGAVTGGGGILSGLFGGLFGGVPKLASGGILSGPSLVMAGEYPGARSNPEVIAPLNDLKKYGIGGGGNINVVVSGKLQGNDIALQVERVMRDYNRRN